MVNYYRKSLRDKVNSLEKSFSLKGETALFIDMNADGTFGTQNFTEDELHEYAKNNNHSVVIIDDIL